MKKLVLWALAIIFFPIGIPVGLFLMWKNKKFSKAVRVGLTIFGLLIVWVVISPSPKTPAKPEVKEVKTETVATESAKPLTIDQKIDQSAKSIDKSATGEYQKSDKVGIFTFSSVDFWDEKTLVNGAFRSFVKFGKMIDKLDEIDNIEVVYKTEFTDSYGQKKMDNAVDILMSKGEFNKFNWDNLQYQPIYYPISKSALILSINPGILKKIKLDEITL